MVRREGALVAVLPARVPRPLGAPGSTARYWGGVLGTRSQTRRPPGAREGYQTERAISRLDESEHPQDDEEQDEADDGPDDLTAVHDCSFWPVMETTLRLHGHVSMLLFYSPLRVHDGAVIHFQKGETRDV